MITESAKQTKELGKILARELRGGEVLCLDGELGAGKTTFTQGLLQGLKIKGPYTSPTFIIMRHYNKEFPISKSQFPNTLPTGRQESKITNSKITNIYHIDAYRIGATDLLDLGWKEIMANKQNVTIVEWSDRVKKILPKRALKITFAWLDKNKRQINLS